MNISLVSNSCIPNADLNRPELQMADGSQDLCNELRAIKDISKGEEITIFYYLDVRKYGSVLRKCEAAIRKYYRREEEKKRGANTCRRILDLTMKPYIDSPIEKIRALGYLASSAHLARDKDLVMKAMDKLRQLAEDNKLEYMRRCYDTFKFGFSQCSAELSSGIPP